MKINFAEATRILEEEVEQSNSIESKGIWVDLTKELADKCKVKNKTMIAMLGTALLAKATDVSVDPYSLQVGSNREGNTYSARALCKEVLAANSKRLGIDIGVTGREPLNNQPFFGKKRVTSDFKVRSDAQEALLILLKALDELNKISTTKQARIALRSFLQVQKRSKPQITLATDAGDEYDVNDLIKKIDLFVSKNSEGGKRAQAVSAALLDVLYGERRIDAKRINDPGRKMPGDIGVFERESRKYERVFEVKDKPINNSDIQILLDSVFGSDISIVSLIAVSQNQERIDINSAIRWAEARQIRFRIFIGWDLLVSECLFWSSFPHLTIGLAYRQILKRLQYYEITNEGIFDWEKRKQE